MDAKEPKTPVAAEPMQPGTACLTLWMDAHGKLRFANNDVGVYTMVGWLVVMLGGLLKQLLGRKIIVVGDNQEIRPEEVYKSDNLKLIRYLIARGCRLKDAILSKERRVDFFVVGPDVFALVKDYETLSPHVLVSVHALNSADENLKDKIGSLKKQARS